MTVDLRGDLRARLTKWAEEYDRNPEWVLADAAVGWLFRMRPANDDAPTVLAKVVTLDALYATNLGVRRGVRRGGLWHEVTHRIVGLKPAFDEALRAEDPAAVDQIGETSYVFATKYAHWHNPTAFPIYDSRVAGILPELARQIGVTVTSHDLLDYRRFKAGVDAIRSAWVPEWSYKQIDKALWIGAESSTR